MDLELYLSEVNFKEQYEKLCKKLKGKSVIIYGTGSLFELIREKYDLSKINIIGISDKKYKSSDETKEEFGYRVIPVGKIPDFSPDYVLVATLNYVGIICNFEKTFKKSKIRICPLVKKKFWTLIKEFW